jgi:hypothetical protein
MEESTLWAFAYSETLAFGNELIVHDDYDVLLGDSQETS